MPSIAKLTFMALGLLSFVSARKTSIFIDQIPLYSKLPECAENRLSAIVRAQSSGCGDNQVLTSFSCFCLEQSTMMASIISKDVQSQCGASMTASESVPLVTPLPQVTDAINVWNSYCERSTELSMYQDKTSSSVGPVTVTAAPSPTSAIASSTSSPSPTPDAPKPAATVPVAAIAVPVVIALLAVAGVFGFLLWRRKNSNPSKQSNNLESPENSIAEAPYNPAPSYTQRSKHDAFEHGAPKQYYAQTHEIQSSEKSRFELESTEKVEPIELDSGNSWGLKKGEKKA